MVYNIKCVAMSLVIIHSHRTSGLIFQPCNLLICILHEVLAKSILKFLTFTAGKCKFINCALQILQGGSAEVLQGLTLTLIPAEDNSACLLISTHGWYLKN